MSFSDELDDRGLGPFAALLALSLVSANRGAQLLFGIDLVSTVAGQYANILFAFAGIVGLLGLLELLTDLEVIPDDWRL
ncbi:hypothetical protein [Haloarchaeobius sp. DYHT-AS-18]|uniref:hypothetical protein n=1 Tax=Haloarchaeobius sp. DYHT-AS-18 TaxID=3446117 RepID=UPI003EB7E25D